MRVLLDGIVVFEATYEDDDALLRAYVEDQTSQGRSVPSYDLIVLLGAIAAWLLGKAADVAVDRALEHRERRDAKQKEAERDRVLEEIRGRLERLEAGATDDQRAGALVESLRATGAEAIVDLETPAERNLRAAMAKRLEGTESRVVGPDEPVR